MSIVKVDRLSHRYHKDWAIRDISFEIECKGVLGLLGSNGAGKSTVMNVLCGVLNQTQGDVCIDGFNMRQQPEEAKKRIGFLPQNAPLHLELTVEEYLRHCAALRNVPGSDVNKVVRDVMERCGVAHFSKRLLRNLSGGYRQRVGIAQAIVHHPKVVVLDEPTNGLDPNQILEMRKLIKQISEESVVIFSSHILAEVQATCRDVKMIEQGRLVFADSMDAFDNHMSADSLLLTMDNPPASEELSAIPGITQVERLSAESIRLRFNAAPELSKTLIRMSLERGWELTGIVTEKKSLDQVFAQLSRRHSQ